MRCSMVLAVAAFCILPVASLADDPQADKEARAKLVGTWKNTAEGIPDHYRHLKHITPTHFIWVLYDKEKMSTVGATGGTWTLQGDTYKEKIDYATDGWEHLRGKEYTFKVKLDGDKWFHTGELDEGTKINETWEKQK